MANIRNNKMEQVVLNFIRKGPDEDGVVRLTLEEAQCIVQMILATYNKVDQLCAAMYRQEHEKSASNSSSPYASRNPFL